ncbi:MAG: geranylgeranyl reductase family protein, partial [Chloroflexota bacterium]
GIAGPGGATPGKEVGLFYLGLAHRTGTMSREHRFQGDREESRRLAAETALAWLKEYLTEVGKDNPGRRDKSGYDVIIAGAGPAGATLACELARANVSVLLLEKEVIPRHKTCAGGISLRAAGLLGFSIDPVVENVIYGARLSYQFREQATRFSDQPIIYMVSRGRFDQFLCKQAQNAGAEIRDGHQVLGIESQSGSYLVQTDKGNFTGRVMAGADGVNSVVARGLSEPDGFSYYAGLEAEVHVDQDTMSYWNNLLGLDFGTIPGGYGWLFPKRDHLSIGVVGPNRFARRLNPYLRLLLEYYCPQGYDTGMPRGALLRVRKPHTPITFRGRLLVGDAAGMGNAFTGEGIYYAIRSAGLAAHEIVKFLEGETLSLKGYEKAIEQELSPEQEISHNLAAICAAGNIGTSRIFFSSLVENERLWRALCQVLSGQKTYPELKNSRRFYYALCRLLGG